MTIHRLLIYSLSFALMRCGSLPAQPSGPLRMTDVHRESRTGARVNREEIITSPERWREVWQELVSDRSPKPTLPPVDFSSNALVYVARGETGDACRSIRITRVELRQHHLTVFVNDSRLPMSCDCPPVTIQPVHIVAVPRVSANTNSTFQYQTVTEGAPCD